MQPVLPDDGCSSVSGSQSTFTRAAEILMWPLSDLAEVRLSLRWRVVFFFGLRAGAMASSAGNVAQKHVASPVYLRCQIVGDPLISVEDLYQPAMRLPDRRLISIRLQPKTA